MFENTRDFLKVSNTSRTIFNIFYFFDPTDQTLVVLFHFFVFRFIFLLKIFFVFQNFLVFIVTRNSFVNHKNALQIINNTNLS